LQSVGFVSLFSVLVADEGMEMACDAKMTYEVACLIIFFIGFLLQIFALCLLCISLNCNTKLLLEMMALNEFFDLCSYLHICLDGSHL
jgi:hypothetical protein